MVSGPFLQVVCLTSVVVDIYYYFFFLCHPYYYFYYYYFHLIASSGEGEGGSQLSQQQNLDGYIRCITGLGFEEYRGHKAVNFNATCA